MKVKQIMVAIGLVVILFVGTTIVASAEPAFGRLAGGGNWVYEVVGWAWGRINVTFDPVTGDADGFLKYMSYSEDKPGNFGGWEGKAICTALGEFEGLPTLSIVVEVTGGTYWEYGTYAKFIVADGGNEADDLLGLSVWGMDGPVPDMPSCEFEPPFYWWPVDNGNFTLHIP